MVALRVVLLDGACSVARLRVLDGAELIADRGEAISGRRGAASPCHPERGKFMSAQRLATGADNLNLRDGTESFYRIRGRDV